MASPIEEDERTDADIKALLLAKLQHKHDQRVSAFQRKEKRHLSPSTQPSFNQYDHQKTLEVYRQRYFQKAPVKRTRSQIWLEVVLTLLEVAAIVALVWLLVRGFQSLQEINAIAKQSYAQQTPPSMANPIPANLVSMTPYPEFQVQTTLEPSQTQTPAIIISTLSKETPMQATKALVLPSGHLPPKTLADVPIEVTPASTGDATQTPKQDITTLLEGGVAVWIKIPAIGVDHPVVQGDDDAALKLGVGQHPGSALPGFSGNLVLSAHNDIFGEIFKYLDQLSIGDEIIILTQSDRFTYLVEEIMVVKPDAVEILELGTRPTVTLISCYPYWIDTHRIVVRGVLLEN